MATKQTINCETSEIEITNISDEEMQRRSEESAQMEKSAMRNHRNALLKESDWTQLPDISISPEVRVAWQIYRQKLRDITDDSNWPYVVWPMAPQ